MDGVEGDVSPSRRTRRGEISLRFCNAVRTMSGFFEEVELVLFLLRNREALGSDLVLVTGCCSTNFVRITSLIKMTFAWFELSVNFAQTTRRSCWCEIHSVRTLILSV